MALSDHHQKAQLHRELARQAHHRTSFTRRTTPSPLIAARDGSAVTATNPQGGHAQRAAPAPHHAPRTALRMALSPYHLTTLEVGAMAALQLGDEVITCLPTPPKGESREALAEAVAHSPRYRRVLDGWSALAPLWESGVLRSLASGPLDPGPSNHNDLEHGIDPADIDPWPRVLAASQRLVDEASWSAIRPFAHAEAFASGDEPLDALCADLLKGGPDPGLALPITAGLDAFARAHGLVVVRSIGAARSARDPLRAGPTGSIGSPGSLAQQAEARLATPLLSVGLPLLTQASASTIMLAREALREPREALARALLAAPNHSQSAAAARAAATTYAAAFRERLAGLIGRDDDHRARVVAGFASLHLREVPPDAALLAAVMAIGRSPAQQSHRVVPRVPTSASPAQHPHNAPGPLRTLTITAMPVTLT